MLLLWIFDVFSVLCLLCLCARLFICALWSPAGKGLTSWRSFVVYNASATFFESHWGGSFEYPGHMVEKKRYIHSYRGLGYAGH